jgi:hypothetical protein
MTILPAASPRLASFDSDYWRRRFPSEPYAGNGESFEDYEPAYRFGHSLQGMMDEFETWEDETEALWDETKGECRLSWEQAREAIRAGWEHAERQVESKFDAAVRSGGEKLCAAYHQFEDRVRRSPGEYVLGGVVTGYVASRLPVRSFVATSVGLAAAVAPAALVCLGIYKVAERALNRRARKSRSDAVEQTPAPAEIDGLEREPLVIATDVV